MSSLNNFYNILCGEYTGYSICLWCGAILKVNLRYHNCLVYPNIPDWHTYTVAVLCPCAYENCHVRNNSVQEYITHMVKTHSTLVFYMCKRCGIGYISYIGVKLHQLKNCLLICKRYHNATP